MLFTICGQFGSGFQEAGCSADCVAQTFPKSLETFGIALAYDWSRFRPITTLSLVIVTPAFKAERVLNSRAEWSANPFHTIETVVMLVGSERFSIQKGEVTGVADRTRVPSRVLTPFLLR